VKPRALISVSNKTGLLEFVRGLLALGWEVVSTGGTARLLAEEGLAVTPVSRVTGFPEILEGRVKTLHPAIHGGILARRIPEHMAVLAQEQITPIDLVVVNLYPFAETIAQPGVTLEDAVENIDIGGPSMVRAAAKNYEAVIVVVNPGRYQEILHCLQEQGTVPLSVREELAVEAFRHTAEYDSQISAWLESNLLSSGVAPAPGSYPSHFRLEGEKQQELRYGENPHQRAAYYRRVGADGGRSQPQQLHGKELSYNNLVDLSSSWSLIQEFRGPAAAIIKHTNPCGVAEAETLEEAYLRALEADPVSAYGGIAAFNRTLDGATAKRLSDIFLEVVAAPAFSPEALAILGEKKNIRLMQMPDRAEAEYEIRTVPGGFLVQESDLQGLDLLTTQVVTRRTPTAADWEELSFAWKVVKHVKSNAIAVCRNRQTLGIGAGQMNRVGSVRLALEQADVQARGAYLASDAFFPFRDSIDAAARAGVRAIIQPGGSVRDEECIAAADEHDLIMVFTGIRHFKH